MRYFQCDFQKDNAHITAWIEARGAKVGASVELKELNEFWTVKRVYTPSIEYDDLKAKQERDRNCLPSLVGA
jgi:hypothetical protein